jgi:hypothetical protein
MLDNVILLIRLNLIPVSKYIRGFVGGTMSQKELKGLWLDLRKHFEILNQQRGTIRKKLEQYADGKKLKGDEYVGWLGEINGKLLLNGKLVPDSRLYSHDLETKDRKRISIKARKGEKGWKHTGIIPEIDGPRCPTHLMFVHLNKDYSVDRIWLYPWEKMRKTNRFKSKKVRGKPRAYFFVVSPESDSEYLIYPR